MSCVNNQSNINETFIIEPTFNATDILSACTAVYTNELISCSGDTYVLMGTGVIEFYGNLLAHGNITGNTGVFSGLTVSTLTASASTLNNLNVINITGNTGIFQKFYVEDVTANTISFISINGLSANVSSLSANTLTGNTGLFNNLTANTINTTNINSVNSNLGNITASTITTTNITGNTANIDTGTFEKVYVENVTGNTIVVTDITGNTSNITNFTGGTITVDDISGDTAIFNQFSATTVASGSGNFTNITGDTATFNVLNIDELDLVSLSADTISGDTIFGNSGDFITLSANSSNFVNISATTFSGNNASIEAISSSTISSISVSSNTANFNTVDTNIVSANTANVDVINGENGVFSALTASTLVSTNQINSHSGNTSILMGNNTIIFNGDVTINDSLSVSEIQTNVLSACTAVFTNELISCSGDTSISIGSNVITFNGDLYTQDNFSANTINASIYYSGGTNLIDILNANGIRITGGTFDTNTRTLTLVNSNGTMINISGFTDYYITGVTYSNNRISVNRNDGISFDADINYFSGLTIDNLTASTISATTVSATTFFGDGGQLTNVQIPLSANTGLEFNGQYYTTYNTTLDTNISMVNAIGGFAAGTTVGSIRGRSLVRILDTLLFPTSFPTYTIPTISLSGISNATLQVGSTYNPQINVTGTKNNAGPFTQFRILRNSTPLVTSSVITSSSATALPNQYGFPDPNNPNFSYRLTSAFSESFVIPAPTGGNTSTTTTYLGDGNYSAGLVKKDSSGVDDTRAFAVRSTNAPQAASNNFQTGSVTITGIYPYFYGTSSTLPTASSIAAAIVGGTATAVLAAATGTLSIPYNVNGQFIWVAYFANNTTKTRWYVNALDNGNIDGSFITAAVTTPVSSPSGLWSNVSFKLHWSVNATIQNTLEYRNN